MAYSTKVELAPSRSWLAYRCFAFTFALLLGGFPSSGIDMDMTTNTATAKHKSKTKGSPPILHDGQSYTILLPDSTNDSGAGKSVVVTPMTVVYDYELHDGEMLFKDMDRIPNTGFDYAVLKMGGIRNLNRDTGEPVSLDEVYLHHFITVPGNEFGPEVLNRKMDDVPFMSYPDGYAMLVYADDHPDFEIEGHFFSNKNLAPINGSLELAYKECNECYYAPGKGRPCTPKASGTDPCCGVSSVCKNGVKGECSCATTTTKSTATKYRIEIDFLVSRDIKSFKGVNRWVMLAPSCLNHPDYPSCDKRKSSLAGGAARIHNVPQQPNEQPYFKSTSSFQSPASGKFLWAQSHMHTGGVNVTLYVNGEIVCSNTAEHGTNPDPSTNARNEQNHIIKIDSCYDQIPSTGIRVEIGDVLTTESYHYAGTDDSRFSSELAAGGRKNAMSMMYTGFFFEQIKYGGRLIERSNYLIKKQRTVYNDFTISLDFKRDNNGLRG